MGGPVGGAVCGGFDCHLSLLAGPGDGSYVPQALDATARAFLGPAGGTTGGAFAVDAGSGPDAGGGLRLRPDRTTLFPGKGTAFQVTANQSLGLRGEISRPLSDRFQVYGAVSASIGQHDYALPQGLGPLTDPITIAFRTGSVTPEIGLRYQQALVAGTGMQLRLSAGAGMVLAHTHTHLTSALLDMSSRITTRQPFVALGAGLVLDRPGRVQVELATSGRLGRRGAGVLRSEIRLSR
jgi:hypothetical protein